MPLRSTNPSLLEADSEEQSVRLLEKIWRFMLFVVVPAVTLQLVLQGLPVTPRWIAIPDIAIVAIGVRQALRAGRTPLAIQILLWGLLALLSLQCILSSGIRSPAVMAYPAVLMMAGWLHGRRITLWMLALSVIWISGLALLEPHFPGWQAPRSPASYWLTMVLVSSFAALLAIHVAERKRSEDLRMREAASALAARLAELQQARDRLTTLFNINPIPVSITRVTDGRYRDVNPTWARVYGAPRDEMIGKTSMELGIWLSQTERDAFANAVNAEGHVSNYLTTFRMRNGEIRNFIISADLVDFDGEPAIFSAFVDITERHAAETSLENLNRELEQRVAERTASLSNALNTLRRAQDELVQSEKLASLGSLVAGVAHELNTPIGNAVLIASTLTQDIAMLETAYRKDELRKSVLEDYIGNTQRAMGLLDQALTHAGDLVSSFKQVAIDQSSERRRVFALHELVRDICETLRPSMRNQAWQLETSLALGVMMDSYPGPLGQVITNLVQNAFFHGLQENVAGSVRIETRAIDEAHVEISVSDDGRGIEAENLGRIFDPFFTTRLGQGGSGLGLSIVYRLITTLLGGRIGVTSTPGAGTRFTAVLPVQAPRTDN